MNLAEGLILVCVLFTLGAVVFLITQLAADPALTDTKLALVVGFGSTSIGAIGTVGGYVAGRMSGGTDPSDAKSANGDG